MTLNRDDLNGIATRYLAWVADQTPWREDERGRLIYPPTFSLASYLGKLAGLWERSTLGKELMPIGLQALYYQTCGYFLLQWYFVRHHAAPQETFADFLEAVRVNFDRENAKNHTVKTCRNDIRSVIMWLAMDALERVPPPTVAVRIAILFKGVSIDDALQGVDIEICGPIFAHRPHPADMN